MRSRFPIIACSLLLSAGCSQEDQGGTGAGAGSVELACAVASDCPDPGECSIAICSAGVCSAEPADARTACAEGVCDGQGACVQCLDAGGCPLPPTCHATTCQSGMCMTQALAAGNACEAGVCDGDGLCVECLDATDCPEPDACSDRVCEGGTCAAVPSSAGTSCAGGACDGMGNCGPCLVDADCASGKCDAGACIGTCGSLDVPADPPSCTGAEGADGQCGATSDRSCCENKLVPCGTYLRSYDGVGFAFPGHPATVSDFRLDTYEITVGRFRAFVEAGYGTQAHPPDAGSGAHPKVAGSGWDPSWNESLLPDLASLSSKAGSCGFSTWTPAPGPNERRPINCITWYETFAFCIWDGGRLPTEAEWNYAATGGSEQRVYPWGNVAGYDHAVYDCGGGGQCDSVTDIAFVGSKPLGDGRFGQADLAGNVWEWNFDWFADYVNPCYDCANISSPSPSPLGLSRICRGGSFGYSVVDIITSLRSYNPSTFRLGPGGRCARDP